VRRSSMENNEIIFDWVKRIPFNDTTLLCFIDGITMSVPLDPANRHYAEILRQVEAGTLVIQEAD
jgi:hypothetical protein